MNNYPEDIRQYDNDPRSPFYDDSYERYIETLAYDIATDPEIMIDVLADSDERYGNIVHILCAMFEEKYENVSRTMNGSNLNKFMSAWLELAEETAKRYAKKEQNEI